VVMRERRGFFGHAFKQAIASDTEEVSCTPDFSRQNSFAPVRSCTYSKLTPGLNSTI